MTLDWSHFTPWLSLAGGVVLGLGAAIFILANGRVLGVSGILGGVIRPRWGDIGWRLAFLAGMLLAPVTFGLLAPANFLTQARVDAGYSAVVVAGLLVGYGTRLGSGCTSGHGICGLARLSPRSMAATVTFMVAGFFIVYVIRHLL
jgi:uncharacterized membrane protein YedE/YeeE